MCANNKHMHGCATNSHTIPQPAFAEILARLMKHRITSLNMTLKQWVTTFPMFGKVCLQQFGKKC
jgi:hypothetical protein